MNMSYCRFRNTLADLQDCFDNMEDNLHPTQDVEEFRARKELIELCAAIASEFEEVKFEEVEEPEAEFDYDEEC